MTWLTDTDAADVALQHAILANGLVNLRGESDSWFEMDRLNEFLNLHLKNLMLARRTSSIDVHTLFQQTALSASYCTELIQAMESVFGETPNNRHQDKDASQDVRHLAFQLSTSGSIVKSDRKRLSPFQAEDILSRGASTVDKLVDGFNERVIYRILKDDYAQDFTTHISQLDNFIEPKGKFNEISILT